MPPILIPIPERQNAFIEFPEGTSRRDMHVFLATQEGDLFPSLRDSLVQERERRFELGQQLEKINRSPLQAGSRTFKAIETGLGLARGAIGLLIDQEVADEEFGIDRAIDPFPELDILKPSDRKTPGVRLQEFLGRNPRLPFTRDTKIFPEAPPPLVDEMTGENKSVQFQPMDLQRAFRQHAPINVIGMLGQAGVEAIVPAEEFGFPFEQPDPRGFGESTFGNVSSLFGRMPEFAVGGGFGSVAGQSGARALGLTAVTAQRIQRVSSIAGAFAYSNYIDTIVRDQIDFGSPRDYEESAERILKVLGETSKGALTGVALAAGQSAGGAIFGRAFGMPLRGLPATSIRAALSQGVGKWVGGTATFTFVPPLLEGESPTIEGAYDAAIIMALFGIGEIELAREIATRPNPDALEATKAILTRHGLGALTQELLLPPPPPVPPPTAPRPGTTFFFPKGFRERPPESFRVEPEAPEIRPQVVEDFALAENLRRMEQERPTDPDALERDIALLEGPREPQAQLALPRPPEQFIPGGEMVGPRTVTQRGEAPSGQFDPLARFRAPGLRQFEAPGNVEVPVGQVDAPQPVIGPIRRPSLDIEANVGVFPRGPSPRLLKLRERKELIDAESRRVMQIDPEGNVAKAEEMARFREFQETDLARKRGVEEQPVEPQEVAAEVRAEADIEAFRRDSRSSQEALESLTKDLAVIEAKETPEAVREAAERVSVLSEESVKLRDVEARDLARQIVEADIIAEGESIVGVVSVNEARDAVRVRVRTNEGTEDILDVPIREAGIRDTEMFVEADRRARASIDAAVEGSRAIAEQDGALKKVKDTLLAALERLKEEELGAIRIVGLKETIDLFRRDKSGKRVRKTDEELSAELSAKMQGTLTGTTTVEIRTGVRALNPFNRKRTQPKTQPDEYTPPDYEQVTRHRLMSDYVVLTQQVDLLRNALNRPELTPKERKTIQRRLALKREEQILYSRALQVAPFGAVDQRDELAKVKFNDLRAVAKQMRIKLKKNPTREDVEDAIVARRNETRGQIFSVEEQSTLARQAYKEYRDEYTASVNRFLVDMDAEFDWLLSQISVNHDIIKKMRALTKQHPEMEEMFTEAIVEVELQRSHSAGGQHAEKLNELMYGGLSRSEKNMLDMVIRMRGDIALNAFDPSIKGTYDTPKANAILKDLAAQDRDAFLKVDQRANAGFAEYRKLLDFALEEELVTSEAVARMAKIGEFLPIVYAELVDAKVLGIGTGTIPVSSPVRRRGGGREIERPSKDAPLEELIGAARQLGQFPKFRRGMSEQAQRDHTNALIDKGKAGTEARILDGITLNQRYVTNIFSRAQRNRASHVLARIAEELPHNGFITDAKMHRESDGGMAFDKVDAAKEIIPYLVKGELRGLVVDKNFADAFNLRSQNNAIRAVAGVLNWIFMVPLGKATMTGPLNPSYPLIAAMRDATLARVGTPIVGRKVYESAFPGVAEAMILGDLQHVAKDALNKGPLYEEFMDHGGGLHWLAQETVFRRGNKPTDAIRAVYKRFEMAQVNNDFITGLQNITSDGIPVPGGFRLGGVKQAKHFVDAWTHVHSTQEISFRMALYHRAKINIAKDKGISVGELTDADMRMAAVISRSYADFSDGSALTSLAEPVAMYFRAGMMANRSVGRTIKPGGGASKADTGIALGMLVAAGVGIYNGNFAMNPQAMIDAPSWIKTDLFITPPEWLMPKYVDEQGNEQHPYIRLATDQPLSIINVLSYNLAAAMRGHWDNVDPIAAVHAAERIMTFPHYRNASPGVKIWIAQMTDASTWEAGRHIWRGPAGVARSEQVDPRRTAPIAERIGRMVPFDLISPDILSASTKDAFGNSLGADLIAWGLNKASGIEDTRIKEIKAAYMKIPLMRAVVNSYNAGGTGFARELDAQNEETTRRETLEIGFQKEIQWSRIRNGGKLPEKVDPQMKKVLEGVSSEIELKVLLAALDQEFFNDSLREASVFPSSWRLIFRADGAGGSAKFYGMLSNMTPENRDRFFADIPRLAAARVKPSKWWGDFFQESIIFQEHFKNLDELNMARPMRRFITKRREEQGLAATAQ